MKTTPTNTILVLGLLLLPVSGCIHGTGNDHRDFPPLEGLDKVKVVDFGSLQTGVRDVVSAHSDCHFSKDLMDQIPNGIDGKGSWAGAETVHCLGSIEVSSWHSDHPELVSIQLVPEGLSPQDKANIWVMFASRVSGRWLFTWPVNLGPDLHPVGD